MELNILRNLSTKDWHDQFGGNIGLISNIENCSCPYKKHNNPDYVDRKDPFNLASIISLKRGTKILFFTEFPGTPSIKCKIFKGFNKKLGYIRLVFGDDVNHIDCEQLSSVRWIVPVPDYVQCFEKFGNIADFALKISNIFGGVVYKVMDVLNKIKTSPIDPNFKISITEIIKNLEEVEVPA